MRKTLLENSVCFDIETLPLCKNYNEMQSEDLINSWEKRCDIYYSDYMKESSTKSINQYQACWERFGGVNPEYSKILCISYAAYSADNGYIVKTIAGEDEKQIITTFFKVLTRAREKGYSIIGHNIKAFDIPFIIKRALINGYKYTELPAYLNILFKKPWDLDYIKDTKEMWSFGSYKMFPMLEEITSSLGIESPKNGEVKGEEIYDYVYNQNEDLQKIYEYCERDVICTLKIIEVAGL